MGLSLPGSFGAGVSYLRRQPHELENFFFSTARWMCCCSYSISLSAFIYQDVAEQVELWLNCLSFPFFLATIYFQSILNRTDALFWFMLNLTFKVQHEWSFCERGGTYCHPWKLRYHAINPLYLKETSLCSPSIWSVNLLELSVKPGEFVRAFIILESHA